MPETPQTKDFRCRSCKAVVASTDGTDLFFGVQKVAGEPLKVRFLCPLCRRPLEWRSTRNEKTVDRNVEKA